MSKKYEHELAVEFGGVSIGDMTASIGVGFERNGHALDDVEAMLCGKRLEVLAVCGEALNPSQQQLPGMEGETHPHVAATCDSASLRVTPKQYGSRLRFSLEEIDVQEIAQLAKRNGTLRVNVLGALEESEEGSQQDAPDRQKRLPARRANPDYETWAKTPIEELAEFGEGLPAAKIEALKESELEIKTIGRLTKAIETDPQWHRKVRGFGPKWIDRLSDSLAEFLKVNPAPDREADGEPEASYPDRNGDGTDCSTENVNERSWDGEGWEVLVTTATGSDGQYRSCVLCTIGDQTGGREIPIEESRPYETETAAALAALDELIIAWSAGDKSRKQIAETLRAHRDEFAVPDVPNAAQFSE